MVLLDAPEKRLGCSVRKCQDVGLNCKFVHVDLCMVLTRSLIFSYSGHKLLIFSDGSLFSLLICGWL